MEKFRTSAIILSIVFAAAAGPISIRLAQEAGMPSLVILAIRFWITIVLMAPFAWASTRASLRFLEKRDWPATVDEVEEYYRKVDEFRDPQYYKPWETPEDEPLPRRVEKFKPAEFIVYEDNDQSLISEDEVGGIDMNNIKSDD